MSLSEYEDQQCNFSEEIYQEYQQKALDLIRLTMDKSIIPRQKQQSPLKYKEPLDKTKPIKKQSANDKKQNVLEKKKYEKRRKDPQIKIEKGRPNNMNAEKSHLNQNKKYNDIVYHYARFLIFLKFNQGKQIQSNVIEFPSHLTDQIDEAAKIMNRNNYPNFEQDKPVFLLHPNSPHYVLSVLQSEQQKRKYTSNEMLAVLLAFLNNKKLLSGKNINYIIDYWPDIIQLFNNPRGSSHYGNIPEDSQERSAHSEPYQSQQEHENNNKNSNKTQQKVKQINPKQSSKTENPNSQYKLLQAELKEDPTIIAYQIACYLHACAEKYNFTIDQ